ncbi:hypothetical protein FACS189487_04890 [Campylobacterota bacterium]|nr:hypothetical protein FACS189487_04890 [Campylobacterota bacterium]
MQITQFRQSGARGTIALFLSLGALLLVFIGLTGCYGSLPSDGDGGGGGSKSKSSLASVDAYFPEFKDSALTVDEITSGKDYSPVSAEKINSFITSSLLANGFTLVASKTDEYEKKSAAAGVDAYVKVSSGKIDLILGSDGTVTHDDALFNTVYGAIDADVVKVYRTKTYNSATPPDFDTYVNDELLNKGKMSSCVQNASSRNWVCYKEVGDLIYAWGTYGNKVEWGVCSWNSLKQC